MPVVVLARDFDVRRLVDEAERARVALEKSARRAQGDEERSFSEVRPGFAFGIQRSAYASCQGTGGCRKREESSFSKVLSRGYGRHGLT